MVISICRTIIIYLLMVVSMRVMGKRQLGELEPTEFVVAVLISDIAANPLADPGTPLLYGVVPIITLIFCEVMLSFGVLKSRKIRSAVSGNPSVIIENGKILQNEMRRNRFTIDELIEHLRKHGACDVGGVKYAVLETDGSLSVIPYAARSPVTPLQMNIETGEAEIPLVLISDGEVIRESLLGIGKDREWLEGKLSENGFGDAKEVFIMTADCLGNCFFAAREPA
ncbi:MAG: DUF421 domain-containing protein [Oscillospiraceae bacterium]|nr:DUF421 domain-containing protein [Oscillospiraceae bacterium]